METRVFPNFPYSCILAFLRKMSQHAASSSWLYLATLLSAVKYGFLEVFLNKDILLEIVVTKNFLSKNCFNCKKFLVNYEWALNSFLNTYTFIFPIYKSNNYSQCWLTGNFYLLGLFCSWQNDVFHYVLGGGVELHFWKRWRLNLPQFVPTRLPSTHLSPID